MIEAKSDRILEVSMGKGCSVCSKIAVPSGGVAFARAITVRRHLCEVWRGLQHNVVH